MRLRLVAFLLFFSSILAAQPGGGGPGGGGDPDVPLGSIEILVVAGALLGVKKAIEQRKNK